MKSKISMILLLAASVASSSPHYPLTNQGAIFDSTKQSYYPCAVDMRGRGLPIDWAVYASTDHGGGHIWLYVANGDPSVKSNWITYDSAKSLGWFNTYTSKPSGNPIFTDYVESSGGAETPCLNWVRDTLFMTYQVVFTGVTPQTSYMSGLSQGTAIAYSTDGVNFARYTAHTAGASAIVLPEPLNTPSADHTGYFNWGINPFDSIPYTYVGNSLLISGQYSAGGFWGSNDALNWTFLSISEPIWQINNRVYGLDTIPILQGVSLNTVKYENCRKLSNGDVVTIGFGITPGWATQARYSNIYEITWQSDGLTIPRYCEKMMDRSGERWDRNEHSTPTTLMYNNKLVVFYTAVDSETNRLAMATCNLSDTNKVSSAPIYNPNISKATLTKTNFVQNPALSTLPTWLTWVSSGTAVYSFSTAGINLLSKSNTPGFRVTNAIVPQNYDFIEYYIDCEFKNGQGTTGMAIKTGTGYQATGSQVDGIGMIAYSGVSFLYVPYTRKASTTVFADTSDFRCFRGISGFGLRWWPRAHKAQILGSGHSAGQVWDVDSTMNLNQSFYPTFWRQSNDTMRIMNITLLTKARDTIIPTVTNVSSKDKVLSIAFNEAVDYNSSGVNGFKVLSPDSIPITYLSGIGTDTLKYTMTRKGKDSIAVSYNKNIAGIIDYGNNALDSSSVKGLVNNKITGNNKPSIAVNIGL